MGGMSKKLFALLAVLAGAFLSVARSFDLEWNVTYDTSVPYEVEISPLKLERLAGVAKGAALGVKADGAAIPVSMFKGRAPGSVRLRFMVPAGTKKLSCEAHSTAQGTLSATIPDNLFAGVLTADGLSRWQVPKTIKATSMADGILFEATKYGEATVSCTVDLPPALAGKPAQVAFDVKSLTPMVWGGTLKVVQVDANGNDLPEAVSDPRWTSQMRPYNKLTCYNEDGVFHPRAAKLRVEFGLRSEDRVVDAYGLPFAGDKSAALLAKLLVSRVVVRAGQLLPFPKFDDACFPVGVSGQAGDTALALGGKAGASFWYQTHSHAAFAQGHQFRDERACFFPTQAGTVEAWFRSDWSRMAGNVATFFQYHQGYVAIERHEGKGTIVGLTWNRTTKVLALLMQDGTFRDFEGKAKVELPDDTWFHLALQWTPCGVAQVFLDGTCVLTVSLKDFKPFADIADKANKHPNDQSGMEFFVGCDARGSRMPNYEGASKDYPPLEGALDLLRVSTGCRYAGAFVPARQVIVDGDTRALFAFDRSFDGVSGGGLAFIPGCYRASRDRVDHVLVVDGKPVQYYPPANLPENDPAKVLDIHNYPVMPKPAEYLAARREVRRIFEDVKPGEVIAYTAPKDAYPDFIEVANTGTKPLVYPIAVGRGELDVRSFGDLAEGLNLAGATDRDKANRLFQMVINASDYFMNHNTIFPYGSDMPQCVCYDAMVVINSYCGFECGPLNNMAANMFATVANCPAVQTGGYGHSFEEVFYDGKNHIYDLSAQKFFPSMDNETAAYLREVGDQPGIHNRVRYSPDHFMRKGTRGHHVQNPDYRAKVGVTLNPGERFRVWRGNNGQGNNLQCKNLYGKKCTWDDPDATSYAPRFEKETGALAAKHPVRRIDRFFPDFSNGFITFDGKPAKANPAFVNVASDSFCYDVKSGYPITWARYGAILKNGQGAPLEISTDFKTFRALPAPGADGTVALDYLVRARHGYWIRVKAPITEVVRFTAATEVIVNRRTFPGHTKPGANELTLKAVSGDSARVTVQWRENVKEIKVSGGLYSGTIPGFERQTVLVDPAHPLTLAVTGASPVAKAKATTGLKAELANNVLTIVAADAEPRVGAVMIADGEATRELTVVSCANARMLIAAEGVCKGGATVVPPDADRVQAAVMCRTRGDGVDFRMAPLAAGRYLLFGCTRFESGLTKGEHGARAFEVKVPGVKSLARKEKGKMVSEPRFGCAANGNCDFLKAPYGYKGGRGNWKWDYPFVQDSRGSSWSGWEVFPMAFPATDALSITMLSGREKGVELAGVLVVPDTVSQDFRGELKKVFCGLNCQPARICP